MSSLPSSDLDPRLVLPGEPRPVPTSAGRAHRVLAAVLAVGLVAGITLSGGGAGAQTVESLQARAEQLANELEELEQRSSELNEEYLELTEQLDELEAERDRNRGEVEAAEAQVVASRGQAADYLIEAYIGAGGRDGMALGSADPNEAVNSQVMLEVLRGDRQLAADSYAAAKADLDARSAELADSSRELAEAKERHARVVDELRDSVARHDELLANTNSQLTAALTAERERREAEAAARARAAEAAAERAAERSDRAARATAVTAPSRTGGDDGPAPTAPAPAPSAPAPAAPPAPTPPPAPPVAAPNSRASVAIAAAMTRLGTPYRWGGTTPAGFDCSGLMLWSWAHAGVSLPRTSRAQQAYTQRISASQLQPGDLVFTGSPVYHVGMYIGGGQMIHSPQTGDVVKISALRSGRSTTYGRIP